ncbi:hypothetical protein, partial [Bacteroides ovatus]|uniref:hypothetical protein n=1 Tax=Bacteroides ovatus TaxID=28116 RepID=UPI001C700241
ELNISLVWWKLTWLSPFEEIHLLFLFLQKFNTNTSISINMVTNKLAIITVIFYTIIIDILVLVLIGLV